MDIEDLLELPIIFGGERHSSLYYYSETFPMLEPNLVIAYETTQLIPTSTICVTGCAITLFFSGEIYQEATSS